jgi:invasion protein IalB
VLLWLAAAVLAASLPAQAQSQKRVALVIGNGAYTHAVPLPNPSNDADAVGAALRRLRFDHVTVLKDLGAQAFRKALLDFEPEAAAADIALVYFAGHGIEVDGQNFLIPVDARLVRAAAAELEAIPLSTVTGVLSPARKLRLVILDACRTNPFRARMALDGPGGRKRSIGRGLARIEPGENELIAFAAAAGTEADDGSGRQSPFVTALLKHIETPGLDVRILFGKVRDDVLKATSRQQTPHLYGTLGGDEISLAASDVVRKSAATPPPPTLPTRTEKSPSQSQEPLYLLGGARNSWVKLCEKGALTGNSKDGNEQSRKIDFCHTLAERVDGNSGMLIVSVGLNHVKTGNEEKQIFRVILPQGVALSAGIAVTFFPMDLWAKIERNEKLATGDAPRLKSLKMGFQFCNTIGCHVEVEARADLVTALRTSAGFIVTTKNTSGTAINLKVPLAGFNEAREGPPTDTKKFNDARQRLIEDIKARRERRK